MSEGSIKTLLVVLALVMAIAIVPLGYFVFCVPVDEPSYPVK